MSSIIEYDNFNNQTINKHVNIAEKVEKVILWFIVLSSLVLVIVTIFYDFHDNGEIINGNVIIGPDGSIEAPSLKATIITDDITDISETSFTTTNGKVSANSYSDGSMNIKNGVFTSGSTLLSNTSLSIQHANVSSSLNVTGSLSVPLDAAIGKVLTCSSNSGVAGWANPVTGDVSSSGSAPIGSIMVSRHIDGDIIGPHTDTNPGGVIAKIVGSTPTLFGVEDFQSHLFTNRQGVDYRELAQITEEVSPITYGVLRMNNLFSKDGGITEPVFTSSLLQRVGRDTTSDVWGGTPYVLSTYLKSISIPLTVVGTFNFNDGVENTSVSIPASTFVTVGDFFTCEGSGTITNDTGATDAKFSLGFNVGNSPITMTPLDESQDDVNIQTWSYKISVTLLNSTDIDNVLVTTNIKLNNVSGVGIPQLDRSYSNRKVISILMSDLVSNTLNLNSFCDITTIGTNEITQDVINLIFYPMGSIAIV